MVFIGILVLFMAMAMIIWSALSIMDGDIEFLPLMLIGILFLILGICIMTPECCPKCDAVIERSDQTHCGVCGHLINEEATEKEKICEHNIDIDVNCNCNKEVTDTSSEANDSVAAEKDTAANSEPTTETKPNKPNNKNFCGNCGDKVIKDNKYCNNCGSKY